MGFEYGDMVKKCTHLVATSNVDNQDILEELRRQGTADVIFVAGSVTERQSGSDVTLLVDGAGLPVKPKRVPPPSTSDTLGTSGEATAGEAGATTTPPPVPPILLQLTIELAIFVALFPLGEGFYNGEGEINEILHPSLGHPV